MIWSSFAIVSILIGILIVALRNHAEFHEGAAAVAQNRHWKLRILQNALYFHPTRSLSPIQRCRENYRGKVVSQ
jgi:hypothetical protein